LKPVSENANFKMPDKYYANGWHTSKGSFNELCNFMLKCCSKNWAPQSMRKDYLKHFQLIVGSSFYLDSSWNTPCLTAKHVVEPCYPSSSISSPSQVHCSI